MELVVIFAVLYGFSALIRKAKESRRERLAQAERERNARMREEFRLEQARAREEAKRLSAVEREQIRQAKEQAKQAEVLRKHEEQIAKLEMAVRSADRKIERLSATLEDLNESFELAVNEAEHFRNAGDTVKEEKAKQKVIRLRERISKTEDEIDKAMFCKEQAQEKLLA